MRKRVSLILSLVMVLLLFNAFAESPFYLKNQGVQTEPVQAELIHESETIQPGSSFWVGIRLKLDDHWHAYWKNPGDAGMGPVVKWHLPEGFHVDPIQWPTPKKFSQDSAVSFGYEDEVVLLAKITPSSVVANSAEIGADIRWVVCDNASCLPGRASVAISLPIHPERPQINSNHQKYFRWARASLPMPHGEFQAEKKDGFITLQLNTDDELVGAQFFPEETDQIDYSVDAVLSTSPHPSNTYQVILRESDSANAVFNLKGVVVLHTSNDRSVAYAVDVPVDDAHDHDVAITLGDEKIHPASTPSQHEFQGGIGLALVLAFFGGLILNLMPCVLPVVSFKILSFVKMAGQSRALIFRHGVAFSMGVILSFWVLAGVLLMLQAYGRAVGWGFQLQEPLFVAILGSIIFVFALSLFGVFEVGTGVASLAGQAQTSTSFNGLSASFFSGILATVVATPCTGPFLGTAVGFAVTLPNFQAMLIFTTLGLGMASPYLLLGAFPALLRFMPKPGNWMITFKELMGFVMVATVLWLIWVFGAQTDTLAVFSLIVAFFFMAIGCWIFGKWGTPIKSKVVRVISYSCAILFFAIGGFTLVKAASIPSGDLTREEDGHIAMAGSSGSITHWERFSPEKLEDFREQGIPVFVDFTAKWCLICQANHLVLSTDEVNKKFNELGVVRMKADWTKYDSVITDELRKYGRNSVPLYLLFNTNPDSTPAILPQILTP